MTSGATPTPGPWVLAGRYIQGTEQDIGDGDVGRLNIATCAVDWSSNGDPEQQANARLIVRAVNCHADLVAALEACSLALGDNKPMSTAKMWELGAVVRAALAKAQGRKRND